MSANTEFSERRARGMDPAKAARLTRMFESADDLYTTCQKCRRTLRGTLEQIKEGCDCGTTGNRESPPSDPAS